MRKGAVVGVAIAINAICAGCVTRQVPPSPAGLQAVQLALTDPAALREQANAGASQAQLALALVYDHGLHGVSRDPPIGRLWVRRALSHSKSTRVTVYAPGLGGQQGLIQQIYVPGGGVDAIDVATAQGCATALRDEDPSAEDQARCGGPGEFARLRQAWVRAVWPR